MEIRPVKPEEINRFATIQRDAFVRDQTWVEPWAERTKPYIGDCRALIGDEGELKSVLRILFPRLWLGRGSVPLAAITRVATSPEYRRQGTLKQLLIGVMHELRESGYNISLLYPFYFPFYRKFGYEQASTEKHVTLKFTQLQKFKSKIPGRWKQTTVEQWQELNSLYETFCQDTFGRVTRDEEWWGNLFRSWRNVLNVAYSWYDAQGRLQAYIFYRIERVKENGTQMMVRDMAWADLAARHELLAFLANHDSQSDTVQWETAPDDEFFALLDDPREAEEQLNPGYMLRILDAARALEARPWSTEAKGAFSITLKDDVLEWNNRALQVEVAEGRATVRTLPNRNAAGLSCDIRQLSQLYAGYLSPLQLSRLGLLEVRDSRALTDAQKLFSPADQPASHMADHF